MTVTPPPLNDPLMDLDELAVWTRQTEISEDEQDFAWKIIEAVAVEVRSAGSIWWTTSLDTPLPTGWVPLPERAKVIADLVTKNFYEHPTGEKNETVGPLNSGYIDSVLQQVKLTDEQKLILAEEAGESVDDEAPLVGIWALSIDPGPLHHQECREKFITVPYWRATSKPIPYYAPGAFGSPW